MRIRVISSAEPFLQNFQSTDRVKKVTPRLRELAPTAYDAESRNLEFTFLTTPALCFALLLHATPRTRNH